MGFIIKEDGLEDITKSSVLYNQVRIADFLSLYFSISAVFLQIIAYEKDYYNLLNDLPSDSPEVFNVNITIWAAFTFNILLFTSIVLRHFIYFKWLHSKKQITMYDTLRNTGEWKVIVKEVLLCMIMPFPFINQFKYEEDWEYKGTTATKYYKINYILLSVMSFIRIY